MGLANTDYWLLTDIRCKVFLTFLTKSHDPPRRTIRVWDSG